MTGHRGRRDRIVVGLVAALLVGSTVASATPVDASGSPDITGMFIDAWYPAAYLPDRPINVTDPSTIAVVASVDTVQVRGLSTSAIDPGTWSVVASTGLPGSPLEVGRAPYTLISGPTTACGTYSDGWADVLEIERAPDGTITAYAADVWYRCQGGNPPSDLVHAEVRYHSSFDYRAVAISPMTTPGSDIDLGPVPVGDQSPPRTVTVTNTGSVPLSVDTAVPASPDFLVDTGQCSSVVLAPAETCSISVTFRPAGVGGTRITLTILTPELGSIVRTVDFKAEGTSPTHIELKAIESLPYEPTWDGYYWLQVGITPPGAAGTFDLTTTCEDKGLHAALGDGIPNPMVYGLSLPPGPCSASIHFMGSNGWDASDAGPIDFVVPSFSGVGMDSDTVDGESVGAHSRAGLPVTVHATVFGTNGVDPTGGTLRIVNTATDEVLGSMAVTADARTLSVTTAPLVAGAYPFRGEYTGDSTLVGSTRTRIQVVDGDAPDGSMVIDGGARAVSSPDVTLSLAATDPTTSVAKVRVASTSTTTAGILIDGTTVDATSTMRWHLTGGDGTKNVFAQWRDAVGNWSTPTSAAVLLDTTGPDVGVPTVSFPKGASLSSARIPLSVRWTAHDSASGLASTTLQVSRDGGSWTNVGGSTTGGSPLVPSGHAYRFRVIARDALGNATVSHPSSPLRVAAVDDGAHGLKRSGHWTVRPLRGALDGHASYGTTAGSSMTFTATARSIAWAAPVGPSFGWASVYVDGRSVARVTLYSVSAGSPRVVYVRSWTTAGIHSIRVVVDGGSRTRIAIDAFLVAR